MLSNHKIALDFAEAAISQQVAEDMVGSIAGELEAFGGHLVCHKCGNEKPMGKVADRLLKGWPMCCGETMVWHTEQEEATND